jgi:hypothetical protein
MLQLLLDEHISPSVAKGLVLRNRKLILRFLAEWEDGAFLGCDDSACLREAKKQGLTLVTYDRRTIPPLLKVWAEEGNHHGGVIFVYEKTISPSNNGGLVSAITDLVNAARNWNRVDRDVLLRR